MFLKPLFKIVGLNYFPIFRLYRGANISWLSPNQLPTHRLSQREVWIVRYFFSFENMKCVTAWLLIKVQGGYQSHTSSSGVFCRVSLIYVTRSRGGGYVSGQVSPLICLSKKEFALKLQTYKLENYYYNMTCNFIFDNFKLHLESWANAKTKLSCRVNGKYLFSYLYILFCII